MVVNEELDILLQNNTSKLINARESWKREEKDRGQGHRGSYVSLLIKANQHQSMLWKHPINREAHITSYPYRR